MKLIVEELQKNSQKGVISGPDVGTDSSPYPGLFPGWQNFPRRITWYKIWGLTQSNRLCVQEKIELAGTSKRPRLSSTKISGEPLLVAKKMQH